MGLGFYMEQLLLFDLSEHGKYQMFFPSFRLHLKYWLRFRIYNNNLELTTLSQDFAVGTNILIHPLPTSVPLQSDLNH